MSIEEKKFPQNDPDCETSEVMRASAEKTLMDFITGKFVGSGEQLDLAYEYFTDGLGKNAKSELEFSEKDWEKIKKAISEHHAQATRKKLKVEN